MYVYYIIMIESHKYHHGIHFDWQLKLFCIRFCSNDTAYPVATVTSHFTAKRAKISNYYQRGTSIPEILVGLGIKWTLPGCRTNFKPHITQIKFKLSLTVFCLSRKDYQKGWKYGRMLLFPHWYLLKLQENGHWSKSDEITFLTYKLVWRNVNS